MGLPPICFTNNPGQADRLDDFPMDVVPDRSPYPLLDLDRSPSRPKQGEWDSPVERAVLPPTVATVTKEETELSRLFASASDHRLVYSLFIQWGWEEKGPAAGGGHLRMVHPPTGKQVAIMPPNRAGTGEHGNAKAIRKAASIMGLPSIYAFLDGPKALDALEETREIDDTVQVPSEEAPAVDVSESKEDNMPKGNRTGMTDRIRDLILAEPDRIWKAKEIAQALADDPEEHRRIIPLISQAALRGKKQIVRIRQGYYQSQEGYERANRPVPAPRPDSVKNEIPQEEPIGAVLRKDPPEALASTSVTNGSVPDLLSKVTVLDGGRVLFQGDDAALYVVSGVVRLDV
jgi:hypothetical protein